MSEPRKCQFFLRGRCQREKCEFSHVMPSNSSSTATAANGSKDQQTSAPSLSFYQSKIPLPISKGISKDPGSDDESIMRKGGDSDDETESIGSGFTSIAPSTLKASTSMLPPSSIPIPKERLLRDLQVTTHDDHESKIQKPASAEPHKLVEDISQTRKVLPENIPKSNLQEEVSQNTSALIDSVGPSDGTSISTTINEEPALPRQGHKTDNNGLVAKDHNKKEIRRDSKTGFEKFEDYFDSDSDNTTLQDTTVDVTKDTVADKSKSAADKNNEDQLDESRGTEKALVDMSKGSPPKHLVKEDTAISNQKSAIPTDKDRQCSQVQSHATEDNLNRNKDRILKSSEKSSEKEINEGIVNATIGKDYSSDLKNAQQATVTKTTSTAADLSKDWDMDDDEDDDDGNIEEEAENGTSRSDKTATTKPLKDHVAVEKDTAAETIENIESFIQDEPKDTSTPAVHKSADSKSMASVTTKPTLIQHESKLGEKRKIERTVGKRTEEWVTMIFGEDGKQVESAERKNALAAKTSKKSVYDLNPDGEDFSIDEKTPFTTKAVPKIEPSKETPKTRKDVISKRSGVTKIGNNTYYYTGPKGESAGESQDDEGAEEEEEIGHVDDDEDEDMEDERAAGAIGGEEEPWEVDEDEDVESSVATPKKRKVASKSYDSGRKKHNTTYVYGARSTAAKTRRCGECEGCNREDCGKCVTCLDKPKFGGKNSKKQACIYRMCAWKNPSGKRIKPGTAPVAAPPMNPDATTSPAAVRTLAMVAAKRQRDKESTKDTETGGKRGRKSISVISPASVAKTAKKGDDEYIAIPIGVKDTGLSGTYWSDLQKLPPRRRCTQNNPKPEVVQGPGDEKPRSDGRGRPSKISRKQTLVAEDMRQDPEDGSQDEEQTDKDAKGARGKRKRDDKAPEKIQKVTENGNAPSPKKNMVSFGDSSTKSQIEKIDDSPERQSKSEAIKEQSDQNATSLSKTSHITKTQLNGITNSQGSRSVSCVSDTNSQREVVVECFAPYDDHRWVNIGKERDGMSPDAVQYARALRPPYHLLSFLRIKGHSTKGMSCTDKNTMVFVVLEGEITVVLHTTQFNAKKGDSFYIPPKNYYNLINQNAREAELSLIQFQYDGPLPTVSAGSQSGLTKPATQDAASTSQENSEIPIDTKKDVQ